MTSNEDKMGLRYAPFAFTEHGVLMLSSVLKSKRAIEVNIRIMRVYIKLKELLHTHKDILLKLEAIENKILNQDKKIGSQDENIIKIFEYLKQFTEDEESPRAEVGFKRRK